MKKLIILILVTVLSFCLSQENIRAKHTISKEQAAKADLSVEMKNQKTVEINKVITEDDIIKKMKSKDKNWMNLTRKQYLEDFDYLYKELKENYPFFGVAKRKYGIDLAKRYERSRKLFEDCDNDYEFFYILKNEFIPQEFVGHMDLWGVRYLSSVENLKNVVSNFPEYRNHLKPYIKALENPISMKNYKKMSAFFHQVEKKVEEANQINGVSDNTNFNVYENNKETANVTTKIIEKRKIAYIKVKAFDMDCYKEDKKILMGFYKKVRDYDNLIIDISENGGGGMDYFNDLIVSPNIETALHVPVYSFVKAGDNNDIFLKLREGIRNGEWKPIKKLPRLPHMNKDDLKELNYFMNEVYTIKPLEKEKIFKGKIWLLVSERNYSSSEYAAMFSKCSGFAKLVGRNTGGDGIGVDPTYIILPNSGFVIQYSPIYGATADGANSEEFGTKPDILSPKGEKPLDTCLKEIHK